MEFYAPVELERVIHRSARLLDVGIDVEGAAEIAGRSPGHPPYRQPPAAPRPGLRRGQGRGPRSTGHIAAAALKVYEVDERGLDRLDRAVLGALLKLFGGGPVGLSTLAVAVGEERGAVEEVAEPFLVREGLLARTPRGRVATPAAWAHLGLVSPQHGAKGQQGLFGA
ncbi:Holliday junction branch migration complex subunit RuvB OS=Streptomyces microflavus OX=1919 GN=ruvB PE=3 SV=1 [Streptomyces microflavus]